MENMRRIVLVIFSLLVFFTFFGLVLSAIYFFVQWLSSVTSTLAAAVVAAVATVAVSVVSIVLGKIYELRASIRRENRLKQIPVYESLIGFMSRFVSGQKVGSLPTEEESMKFFVDVTKELMIWAADDVLEHWVAFRRFSVDQTQMTADPRKLLFLYEDLIKAIRRDLGHQNRKLKKGDVLALFVNDIDNYL